MDKGYTVNDVIKERPCPSITPVVVEVKGNQVPVIIIKDYKQKLSEVKEDELVGLKSSSMGNKKASLFLMILKFGDNFENTYDVWFDYVFELHRNFLSLLQKQDRIIIDFRDEENERYITLELENTIKEHITYYIDLSEEEVLVKQEKIENIISLNKIKRYTIWSEKESFEIMDKIFEDYPTIEELWHKL